MRDPEYGPTSSLPFQKAFVQTQGSSGAALSEAPSGVRSPSHTSSRWPLNAALAVPSSGVTGAAFVTPEGAALVPGEGC